MKFLYRYLFASALIFGASCDSFLDLEPVNIISDTQVIVDRNSAFAAVLGAYSRLQVAGLYGNQLPLNSGVMSDELTHSGSFPTIRDLDNSAVQASNVTIQGTWQQAYTGIYQANIILESLSGDGSLPNLSDNERAIFIAEARFIRALLHFELLNLWGGIPIATTSSLPVLRSLSRSSAEDCFAFVIEELEAIIPSLEGVDNGPFRVNEWSAKGILARAYLYSGNVSEAGEIADDIIENSDYTLQPNYPDLFGTSGAGANENMFKIFFSANDQSGIPFQVLPTGRFEFAVSPQLLAAYEPGDTRRMVVQNAGDPQGRFATTKYSDLATGTSPTIVVRLAEMYLIRAEANLQSNNQQALEDLNALRTRAKIAELPGPVNIDHVLQERFVELAVEGHRWFDIRRTGKVDEIMSAINPNTWQSFKELLPIPQYEINQNSSLSNAQNPGY